MNRRELLTRSGVLATTPLIGCAGTHPQVAAGMPAGHHHGDPELADAALGCLGAGAACISHCLMLLAGGDTSMGPCSERAFAMRSMMESLAALAHTNSPHLPELARLAAKFCKDCEEECRKHADKHPTCKACAEACAKTQAACAKYTA
jgi:Cys-rich four helix bundle protein (predicted Tat secretion target)